MVILLVSVPVLLLCAALLLLPDANQPCGLIDAIQGRPSGCIANFDPAVGEEFDSFSFLPDGQTLALIGTTLRSGAESHGRLVMIDLANRRIVRSSGLPGAGCGNFVEGEMLCDGRFYSLADGRPGGALPAHMQVEGEFGGFELLPGKRVLVHNARGTAVILDRDTGEMLQSVREGGPPYAREFTVSKDGRILAVGGCDTVELIELSSGRHLPAPVSDFPDYSGTHDVSLTPDGKFLAMACENTRNNNPYRVGVWETATGRQLAAFDTPAWHIDTALSPDGSLLVVNPFGRHLTVFSVKDKRPTRNLEWAVNPLERTDLSGDIDFSPDGKYFGITLDNGRFFLFDVSRWE